MIAALLLQALALLQMAEIMSFKTIIPRANKPIELDVTNINKQGDYFFNFFLQEDSLDGKKIE